MTARRRRGPHPAWTWALLTVVLFAGVMLYLSAGAGPVVVALVVTGALAIASARRGRRGCRARTLTVRITLGGARRRR